MKVTRPILVLNIPDTKVKRLWYNEHWSGDKKDFD